MSVEIAIVLPVLVVLAFVMANIMTYIEVCALFDRIACDAVISQGVSPVGDQTSTTATHAVQSAIEEALDRDATCEVEVVATEINRFTGEEGSFSLMPRLTRYDCTLTYHPWGSSFSIAGITFCPPSVLVHTRSLVVDRYRSGVVL